MKKIFKILTILCTLVVSVAFCACGNKYKNLEIHFVDDNDILMILDDEYMTLNPDATQGDNSSCVVRFSISGVKEKDIGEISVKVDEISLASVDAVESSGSDYAVRLTALKSGNGYLVVTHLGTGVTAKKHIHIDKKASGVERAGKLLVVGIPNERHLTDEEKETLTEEEIQVKEQELNQKIFSIEAGSLLKFNPIDATDVVDWSVVGALPQGVEVGSFGSSIDVNNQIKITSDCLGGELVLKPTLKMNGYDDIVASFTLTVKVVKIPTTEDVDILSNNAIAVETDEGDDRLEGSKKILNGINLFVNSASHKSVSLGLFCGSENLLDSASYSELYDITLNSSSSIDIEDSEDKGQKLKTITGLNYSANVEWISFDFSPKSNVVGDVKSFSIKLDTYLTEVASYIGIKEDGDSLTSQDTSDGTKEIKIDLLDYYAKYNNWGQRFNFEVLRTSTHASLKNLTIKVKKSILSANNVVGGGSARYQLEFKIGGQYLKFVDAGGDYCVSSQFVGSSNIYVKYINNETGNEENLGFEVCNCYDGSLGNVDFSDEIKTLIVDISKGRGVASLKLAPSYIIRNAGEETKFETSDKKFYLLNSGIVEKTDNGKSFGVSISDVVGAGELTDKEKSNINFSFVIKKDGVTVDCFEYYHFAVSNNVFAQKDGQFNLVIDGNNTFNNINIFRNDDKTIEDGEYEFWIYQKSSGYSASLKFYVVTNVNMDNLKVTPFDENIDISMVYYNEYKLLSTTPSDWETNFANYYKYNEEKGVYEKWTEASDDADKKIYSPIYDKYEGDTYILPTNVSIPTTILAGGKVGGKFVENSNLYQYISSISVKKAWTTENSTNVNNYIGYSSDLIASTCRTGKVYTNQLGTVLDKENCYINLTFVVKCLQYELQNGFYDLTGEVSYEKTMKVFVYVPFAEAYFNNKVSSTIAYKRNDDLGYYYLDYSKKDFVLNVPNPNQTSQSMFDYIDFEWDTDHETLASHSVTENERTLNIIFKDSNTSTVLVMANVTQFNRTMKVVCYVTLKEFVNTQNIIVRNDLKTLNNAKYVSLKLGDSYKLNVDIVGEGTHSQLKYVVCDNAGNLSTNYFVDNNGRLCTVDGGKIANIAQDLKVVIFAQDWLARDVDASYNLFDFNDLSNYLINKKYKDRVKVVEIKIRDGKSILSPFMISSASDLRDLASRDGEYYFQLTNDINMSNNAINLGTFKGHLDSYVDYQLLSEKPKDWGTGVYYTYTDGEFKKVENKDEEWASEKFYKAEQSHFTVYNVKLGTANDNDLFNQKYSANLPTDCKYLALFDIVDEGATIKNITFVVDMEGKLNNHINYMGVIGENLGELHNVVVELSGNLNIEFGKAKQIYIGGLVGKNSGKILNTDPNYVFASGNLVVKGDNKSLIYLGGLVGLNAGTIEGVLQDSLSGVEYAVLYEEQGALSNANLTLTNSVKSYIDGMKWRFCNALGSVVGVNLDGIYSTILTNEAGNGSITNAYSSGKLNGEYMIGGIVGVNVGGAISSSVSTTKIEGVQYMGGLVGFDNQGTITNCKYEVYNTYSTSEGGTSLSGTYHIGGIVGYAHLSRIESVSVHSFRWIYDTSNEDYNESEFWYNNKLKNPDIKGAKYVGGIAGYSYSEETTNGIKASITNAISDMFISGEQYCAGILGYAWNIPELENTYVRGLVVFDERNEYHDARVFNAALTEITSTVTFTDVVHKLYSKNSSYAYDLLNNVESFDTSSLEALITKAPTGIDMEDSISPKENINGTTKFLDEDRGETTLSKTIMLYYYNLNNKLNANYANDQKSINTILLDDFIEKSKITISPNDIGVRLKVASSNTTVVTILANGSIRLVGEGVAVVRFYSIINPNVYDEITIVVRSAPTNYEIYGSSSVDESNILNEETLIIVKGTSKYIYENYTGEIVINNTTYGYDVTNDVRLVVNKLNDDDEKITINSQKDNSLKIDNLEPIIVTATEKIDNIVTINMAPYIKFELNGTIYLVKLSEYNYETTKSFKVETKRGASGLNLDVTDAVISVGDEMDMSFEITTDTKIDSLDMSIVVKSQYGNDITPKDINGDDINEYDLIELWTDKNKIKEQKLELEESPNTNNIQTENFTLKVNQDLKVEEDLYLTITFAVQGQKVVMNLTIIPQKITSIVATNFKDDGGWSASSIIRPGKANMIVVDVAPDIAYFEYLEITDMSSQEKIGFIQFDKFNSNASGLGDGKALSVLDEISSDGYGIKLKKQTGDKRFYVYTILDLMAESSITHKLQITAYSSSGYVLGEGTISLESTTFPTIILTYIDAKGEERVEADSRLSTSKDVDLAIGVEAQIKARTINIEGGIEWQVATNYADWQGKKVEAVENAFSIQQKGNGNWYLLQDMNVLKDYTLSGVTVTVTATVHKMTNGHNETGTTSFNFILRKFTLNGVSIKSDIATSQNRVGGVTDKESTLEFYFDKTDISCYGDDSYWNKTYYVDWNKTDDINKLLQNINKLENGVSLKLKNNYTDEEIDLTGQITNNLTTIKSKDGTELIKFLRSDNDIKFVPLTTKLNNWSFKVGVTFKYVNNIPQLSVEEEYKSVTSTFGINISEVSTLYDYKPVSNAQEFLDMVEGNYYILTDNIILTNYEMLNIKLGGFDGNGYQITIKGYDYATMATNSSETKGYFGLFQEIYDGEIIKNLTIVYETDSRDLCEYPINTNGEYYTKIYLAGIAPISNGIITNCEVSGSWNFSASQLAPTSFIIGGVVCENNGYITNTTVSIKISAGGLVGGIAVYNNQKIATSIFKGSIQSYSSSILSNEIMSAGFVLENSGEISLSYVQCEMIESAGSIGGFAYTNSGKISDCCLNNVSFTSRGQVGGFVYVSTGQISRCYVNSLDALQGDRAKEPFVYVKDSGEFEDCYFVTVNAVVSKVKGVSCILKTNVLNKSSYAGFQFVDNDYGVWKMTGNGPIVASAYTKSGHKTCNEKVVNGEVKKTYLMPGTSDIPYLIYNAETYEHFMSASQYGVLYGNYRIVADIDLSEVRDNPSSFQYSFEGILEGNNMIIKNYSLYSKPNIKSIGLFKEIRNAVVNHLEIIPTGIRASSVDAVGSLAGIIESSKIYNITVNNNNMVVLGKNAVGGLAGIIKGSVDINGVYSNVGANAVYRQTVDKKTNIYIGKNVTLAEEDNIDKVSYAGAIAGIVDGYDYRTAIQKQLSYYYQITNIKVSEKVVNVGEIVGGVFGLVGERTLVENVIIDVDKASALKGIYYTGGIVGENRGILKDVSINGDDEMYTLFDPELNGNYAKVCGGIVALNNGGLIYNSSSNVHVVSMNNYAVVGGVVGRNIFGTISKIGNYGGVYGYFAGGICGSDYQYKTMMNSEITSGSSIGLTQQSISYKDIRFNGENIKAEYTIQDLRLSKLISWLNDEKTMLSKLQISLDDIYSYSYNSRAEYVTLNYKSVLAGVCAISDRYVKTEFDNGIINITMTNDKVLLNLTEVTEKNANDIYFIQNTDGKYYYDKKCYKMVDGDTDSENMYVLADKSYGDEEITLISNIKWHKTDNGSKYGELNVRISEGKEDNKLEYCFMTGVLGIAQLDTWNNNDGYSEMSYYFIVNN